LRSRLLTAGLLGTALVLLALFGNLPIFAAVLAIFLGLAALEWGNLSGWVTPTARAAYVICTLTIAVALWLGLGELAAQRAALTLVAGGWAAALVSVCLAERGHAFLPRSPVALGILGWLVLVPLWLSLLWLKVADPHLLLCLLALVWLADTAAYFVGRRWGQRRLAPRVSPGKTWAGVVGALAAAPLVALPLGLAKGYSTAMLMIFTGLCVVTVAASVVGDLFESQLKRHAGVKDSGTILPGHGGVLDRVDSLTAAAPLFYWGMILLVPRT
jgi:phosphatidate cytidylyltransferase